jgi:hypothetical protein
MKSHPSLAKVEMIERSMRCFTLGLLGLLPFIGIPMAVMSMTQYRRVKVGQGAVWNPAGRYLLWGSRCVLMAVLLNGIIALLICIIASLPGCS